MRQAPPLAGILGTQQRMVELSSQIASIAWL
jgi:hypothetical protein